jgi:hypothetical protein
MKPSALVVAAVATASFLGACAESSPPSVPAASMDPCRDGAAWQEELAALDANAVLKIEPTHWFDTCSGAAQVTGTRLLMRRPEASTERLSRMLRCSSARVRVGNGDGSRLPDGRLQLPEGWVDIDVTREAGDYSVRLRAESVPKNIELLRRATAFVRAAQAGTARER